MLWLTKLLAHASVPSAPASCRFIKFPRTVQTIKYGYTRDADGQPIPCRTQDGLPVSLSFAFNYRLTTSPQTLAQLYIDYGEMDAVALAYHRTARNVVRSVASRYSAFYFFFDRASIQLDLQGSTNAALASLGASVEQFQLLDVTFPAEFNDARTRQENAVQQIAQATNERAVAVINAQTRVERAAREAALILSNATAEAEASKLRNQAAVATLIARYTAERESYRALKSSLGLSSQELLTYIWLEAQAEGQSSQTLNVQTPPGLAV